MEPVYLGAEVLGRLPYEPNGQQLQVVAALSRFICADRSDAVFILNGYAGTGKTSLTGALVGALEANGRKVVLMAPTGRAAKVFSANSGGHAAYTIHRKIYRHFAGTEPGSYTAPVPAPNREHHAVFIVDEASMIGSSDEHGASLLDDLVTYVYSGDNCRMILLGDTAQLPPVGSDRSPAMKPEVLRRMGLKVTFATLTAIARQAAGSGILYNATMLRRAMAQCAAAQAEGEEEAPPPVPHLRAEGFGDVSVVDGTGLPELLEQAYSSGWNGTADTILITRSNRRATEYNRAIRRGVLYREEEISRGDMLIVARNHYFGDDKPGGVEFVANGDIVSVEKVYGTEGRYYMRFADVRLRLSDDTEFDIKIILDTLADENANIPRERLYELYTGILSDDSRFGDDPPSKRLSALRTDPYWNALQVKYAYAVTCHKAQGGQWDNVFVDLAYIPADALGLTLYRWLYTAVTRARKHLYLIAPPGELMS